MAQPPKPATRRASLHVHAALTTYARETTAGDPETPPTFRLRKQPSPALRQTQSDKTDRNHFPFVISRFLIFHLCSVCFAEHLIKTRPHKLARVRKRLFDPMPQAFQPKYQRHNRRFSFRKRELHEPPGRDRPVDPDQRHLR